MPQNQDINRNPDGTFPPGVSGNPGGKPKGTISLKRLIHEVLSEPDDTYVDRSKAEELVRQVIDDAIRGDAQARKLVFEYVEGRPRQSVAVDTMPIVPIIDNIPRHEQYIAQAQAAIAEAERIAAKEADND